MKFNFKMFFLSFESTLKNKMFDLNRRDVVTDQENS